MLDLVWGEDAEESEEQAIRSGYESCSDEEDMDMQVINDILTWDSNQRYFLYMYEKCIFLWIIHIELNANYHVFPDVFLYRVLAVHSRF